MTRLALRLTVLVLAASTAGAMDVPVSGKKLTISASQETASKRKLSFTSADAGLGAPYADPTTGASLFVFASNQSGGCRALVDLPAVNWTPIKGDGAAFGWQYKDQTASAGGVLKLLLKPAGSGGKLTLKIKGANFPCDLSASTQAVPVAITLTVGGTRYCAAFGGTVSKNETGKLAAKNAPAPGACIAPDDLTGATLNLLHGLTCPAGTAYCRLSERVDLAGQWIVARGCPDVVAFQEVFDLGPGTSSAALMMEQLTDVCPFPYEVAYLKDNTVDDSLVLSRYRVVSSQFGKLLNGIRNVLHVRVDHPIGLVDVFSTHLAAGVDNGGSPCGTGQPCPPECVGLPAPTVRSCQAEQVALYVEAEHDLVTPALILGDFNQGPGSPVYTRFTGRGWIDAYLGGGNPECVPATGIGCSSGREDANLSELESPALGVTNRIDYAFVVPAGPGSNCTGTLDTGADLDGDGIATRHFADLPNTFGPACGPSPAPICWASDHNGVQVDLNCE